MRTLRLLAFATIIALGHAPPLAAQQSDWDSRRVLVGRDSLQALMGRLDSAAASPAYSAQLRARSRREAALIRTRLREGDFTVGDRIAVVLEGDSTRSDTLTVAQGRILNIRGLGPVPMAGVLRSELSSYLTAQFSRFIANARVRADALIRVSITGAVGRPGFYTLPVETLLDVALMQAGGPTALAKLDEIRVERGRDVLWDREALQQAIIEGRTFNALSMRAGDRIVVPSMGQRNLEVAVRTVAIAASLPFTLLALGKLFGL